MILWSGDPPPATCSVLVTFVTVVTLLRSILRWSLGYYIGAETRDMATSSICLPEPLEDRDAKSRFRRFDVCASARHWVERSQETDATADTSERPRLGYIESLGEDDNASYDALKKAILGRLNPDTDEDRLAAREQLPRRQFREGSKALMNWLEILRRCWTDHRPGCLQTFVTRSWGSTWWIPFRRTLPYSWNYSPRGHTLKLLQRPEKSF